MPRPVSLAQLSSSFGSVFLACQFTESKKNERKFTIKVQCNLGRDMNHWQCKACKLIKSLSHHITTHCHIYYHSIVSYYPFKRLVLMNTKHHILPIILMKRNNKQKQKQRVTEHSILCHTMNAIIWLPWKQMIIQFSKLTY